MKKLFLLLLTLTLSFSVALDVQGQTSPAKDNETDTSVILPPVTMTKNEILSLLTEANHILNQPEIVDRKSIRRMFRRLPSIVDAEKEYPILAQQDVAINNAGELKDKDFTPSLISYLDYVSPNTALSLSFRYAESLEGRRKRHPAYNALIKINAPEAIVFYIKADYPLNNRLKALVVLTDIDYEQAVPLSTKFLQEAEVKKDPRLISWINTLMQKKLPKPETAPVK